MDAEKKAPPIEIKAEKIAAEKGAGRVRAPAEGRGGNIVAALDIGSSKICCLIAELKHHGGLEVIGIGHQASRGVKSGAITDLKACEMAVSHAVEAAEQMASQQLQGQPIRSVVMNVPGTQVLPHHLDVTVKVSGHEIAERDVRSALSHARGVAMQGRDELIHVIPASYSVDGQKGIAEPRGMRGQSLNVGISAITALTSGTRNLALVAGANQLEVDAFCAAPYAAGLSALVEDERDLGCTVIDMGGGTTSIAVFAEGRLIYAAAIPVGGQHVTSDIARGLTTSLADAERIKTLYGNAHATGSDDSAVIDVPPVGEEDHATPNYVSRSELTGIIQPRIEETFELVRARLVDSGIGARTGRRVVLTGGASQLAGLSDIGQIILEKQIRLGRPHKIRGLAEATGGPAFSAVAGLLIYAAEHIDEIPTQARAMTLPFGINLPAPLAGVWVQKVTHWLKENW
jgi:cell division protein FtsA